MTIQYGSFFYFFYPGLTLCLLLGLVFLLKNRTEKTKRTATAIVAWLNLLQHLLKPWLYPHLWGSSFSMTSTAYNVCAFLIIVSPFVAWCKSQAVKDFVYTTGIFAGFLTMLLPIWFIGASPFSWEVYRFYICHGLLFLSSALPLILKTHRINWKSCLSFAPLFILMLIFVLVNNIFCVYMGLSSHPNPENLHIILASQNPLWMMGPQDPNAWFVKLLGTLTPDILAHDGYYVPILWYAWPLYIPVTLVSFGLFALADRKRFLSDIKKLFARSKKL